MTLAYLSLGSNVGNRLQNIRTALNKIFILPETKQLRISRFYQTSPAGIRPQGDFINAACCFHTSFSAEELLLQLQKIETAIGKTPKPTDAPRPIDIDIIFFGTEVIDLPHLSIPHPFWHQRLFVMIPLSDLTREIALSNQMSTPLQSYIDSCPNQQEQFVKVIEDYS